MIPRPWIIRPRTLALITGGCIAYWLIMASLGFDPFIIERRKKGAVLSDLIGLAIFWTLLCSGVGWLSVSRPRRPLQGTRIWPIFVIPMSICAVVSATKAWKVYEGGLPTDSIGWWLDSTIVASPMLIGVVLCVVFWIQAKFWQKLGSLGLCYKCGYDLTGNTSGRCPECGLQIREDGTTRLPDGLGYWPELFLFDTAEERDAAWRWIGRKYRLKPLFWIQMVAILGLCLVFLFSNFFRKKEIISWGALSALGVISVLGTFLMHRIQRRMLREKLIETGIPVCMKCGHDLRDVSAPACPGCGKPIPA